MSKTISNLLQSAASLFRGNQNDDSVSKHGPAALGMACAAAMAVAPLAASAGGTLTFNGNFQGNRFVNSPNGSSGWMTSYLYGLRTLSGNNEWECYTDRSVGTNPFSVANGILTITAAHSSSNVCGLPYTSGMITTAGDFHQLYGWFEIRAKLPAGAGLWPAFWLLPSSGSYTSELDVFEVLGQNPTTLYSTVHGSSNGSWFSDLTPVTVANVADGFHTYSVNWTPSQTYFFVDGTLTATAPTPQSMDTPMYMIANLAVGGNGSWPGAPTASTVFPAHMQIRWMHAWTNNSTQEVGGSNALVQMGN